MKLKRIRPHIKLHKVVVTTGDLCIVKLQQLDAINGDFPFFFFSFLPFLLVKLKKEKGKTRKQSFVVAEQAGGAAQHSVLTSSSCHCCPANPIPPTPSPRLPILGQQSHSRRCTISSEQRCERWKPEGRVIQLIFSSGNTIFRSHRVIN